MIFAIFSTARGVSYSAFVGTMAAMTPLCVLSLFLLALPAGADPLVVGSDIASFSLEDQYGIEHSVDGRVRAILFAREMEGGEVVKAALEEFGAELLEDADAVYIADVSGMPAIIRRMFALRKMRRRGYPMLLDIEGMVTRDFPGSDGHATMIHLESSRIAEISHYDSAEDLRSALRLLFREPPAESTHPH